mgnify:CR=1 FL=1
MIPLWKTVLVPRRSSKASACIPPGMINRCDWFYWLSRIIILLKGVSSPIRTSTKSQVLPAPLVSRASRGFRGPVPGATCPRWFCGGSGDSNLDSNLLVIFPRKLLHNVLCPSGREIFERLEPCARPKRHPVAIGHIGHMSARCICSSIDLSKCPLYRFPHVFSFITNTAHRRKELNLN